MVHPAMFKFPAAQPLKALLPVILLSPVAILVMFPKGAKLNCAVGQQALVQEALFDYLVDPARHHLAVLSLFSVARVALQLEVR
jgi:hypothetical protein